MFLSFFVQMSSLASLLPPECLWPSELPLLSKPSIPVFDMLKQPYKSQGANNDSSGHARHNCCWIETSFHILLADPYIRYFAADQGAKSSIAHYVRRSVPATIQKKYDQGCLVMDILALRYGHRSGKDQTIFDDLMTVLFRDLRAMFPSEQVANGMGEVGALVSLLLPAVRCFIALHWSGHPLQRQFLANGSNPVIKHLQSCPNRSAVCPLAQKEHIGYNVDGHPLSRKDMTLDTDVVVIKLDGETASIDLQDSIMKILNTKWKLADAAVCKNGVCSYRRLEQRSMANLPWMMYVNTARTSAAAGEARRLQLARELGNFDMVPASSTVTVVRYNPEKMMLGPTADGQYAIYKLVARDSFVAAHFNADVRLSINDPSFCNWNFSRQTRFVVKDADVADLRCSFLVWQRVE